MQRTGETFYLVCKTITLMYTIYKWKGPIKTKPVHSEKTLHCYSHLKAILIKILTVMHKWGKVKRKTSCCCAANGNVCDQRINKLLYIWNLSDTVNHLLKTVCVRKIQNILFGYALLPFSLYIGLHKKFCYSISIKIAPWHDLET